MFPGVQYSPSRKSGVTPAGVRYSKELESLMWANLMAPQSVGNPNKRGKGGYAGYIEWLATKYPRMYVSLLTQFLPLLLAEDAKMAECENAKEMLLEKVSRIINNVIHHQEAEEARRIANGSGDPASSSSFDNASKNGSCTAP